MNLEKLIERADDILGGPPAFAGTRVPVRTLFDYLEAGDQLDDFLDDFPSIEREQAQAVIALARTILAGRDASAA